MSNLNELTRYEVIINGERGVLANPEGSLLKFADVKEAKILQSGEAPVQQLKAEIRSALGRFAHDYPEDFTKAAENLCDNLRELSAV